MGIETILYQFIFMPLQLLFELLYYLLGYKLTKDPGLSIIVLSLAVNLLVLPLYNRADAVQEAEREIDAKLRKGVEHIKKTFKGDEQLMMLQTYYRQNNYSPFDVIKGSISLFLEIPFFVAAYQFLSHLPILQGATLGPIKDLAAADALLTIAGQPINVLPIIMTVVNLAATCLFVTNMPTKTKLQLYGLAFFFLVFLYNSPSGLVFYWTLNNVFNLVKTIVYKFRKPAEASNANCYAKPTPKLFLAGAAFMAVLTGLLIPSTVISTSPQEFILFNYVDNPVWFVVSAFAMGLGAFVLWLGVFYWLGEVRSRLRYEVFITCFSLAAIVTYMFWGKNTGILTSLLSISNGLPNSHMDKIINGIVVLAICLGINLLWPHLRKYCFEALTIGCLAMLGMSTMNIFTIQKSIANVEKNTSAKQSINADSSKIVLSKNGKNVIVFMLDGALGSYIPFIMQEKPELKEAFSGFTYHSNVISYGGHTLFGSAGIFGGYEYTPVEMNKRQDKILVEKHNEALSLLPRIFHEHGYNTTVSNLPLANYQWIFDPTAFKTYPFIRTENFSRTLKNMDSPEDMQEMVDMNKRNFFVYGLMKSVPAVIQGNIYGNGHYNRFGRQQTQQVKGIDKAIGINKETLTCYQALEELKQRTKLVEQGNTYLAMVNDITHAPMLLQEPDYVPSAKVDNSAYAKDYKQRFKIGNHRLIMKNMGQVTTYHVNMAAYLKLAQWFAFLKEQGVYDNTRIILVADHGWPTGQVSELNFSSRINVPNAKRLNGGDACNYFPLLMVKDFNATGFKTNSSLMTNADVPWLALAGLVKAPVNPFTGNPVKETDKSKEQYILESNEYEVRHNSGPVYAKARWYGVKNNIWDKNNWRLAADDSTSPTK